MTHYCNGETRMTDKEQRPELIPYNSFNTIEYAC